MEDPRLQKFLGDQNRAEDFRQWRMVLEERLKGLRQTLQTADDPVVTRKLRQQIQDLQDNLAVLRTEEPVAQFVEDSAKATLARPESEMDDERLAEF